MGSAQQHWLCSRLLAVRIKGRDSMGSRPRSHIGLEARSRRGGSDEGAVPMRERGPSVVRPDFPLWAGIRNFHVKSPSGQIIGNEFHLKKPRTLCIGQ